MGAVTVDDTRRSVAPAAIAGFFDRGDLRVEFVGVPAVVRVEECDVGTRGGVEASLPDPCEMSGVLPTNGSDARIRWQRRNRSVRRAVVDDEQFPVRPGLGLNRRERRGKPLRPVERREDDADERSVRQCRRACRQFIGDGPLLS